MNTAVRDKLRQYHRTLMSEYGTHVSADVISHEDFPEWAYVPQIDDVRMLVNFPTFCRKGAEPSDFTKH